MYLYVIVLLGRFGNELSRNAVAHGVSDSGDGNGKMVSGVVGIGNESTCVWIAGKASFSLHTVTESK